MDEPQPPKELESWDPGLKYQKQHSKTEKGGAGGQREKQDWD